MCGGASAASASAGNPWVPIVAKQKIVKSHKNIL
jgi:hypothetical protein